MAKLKSGDLPLVEFLEEQIKTGSNGTTKLTGGLRLGLKQEDDGQTFTVTVSRGGWIVETAESDRIALALLTAVVWAGRLPLAVPAVVSSVKTADGRHHVMIRARTIPINQAFSLSRRSLEEASKAAAMARERPVDKAKQHSMF